jgi:ABC-2 type transport system permease protein
VNIFWFELKLLRKSLIIWNIVFISLFLMFVSLYPSFHNDIETSKKLLESVPKAVQAAVGLSMETMFSVLGFYSYLFTYISLAASVQAMNIGVSLLSKERKLKTEDFLLTKPLNRKNILTSKILAGLVALIITNSIYLIASMLVTKIAIQDSFNIKTFILISLTMYFIQLLFFAIGILLSVVMKKIKSVVSVTLPVVFGFFIIGVIEALNNTEALRFLSPFKYYNTKYIIQHNNYEPKYLLAELIFVTLLISASYAIYNRKDIPSAT